MGFSDELEDIIRQQKVTTPYGEEPLVSPDTASKIGNMLREDGTYGYLVYVAKDGSQGLVTIGGHDPMRLSHSHRIADALIDMTIFAGEDFDED
jgi:hypothetical protein